MKVCPLVIYSDLLNARVLKQGRKYLTFDIFCSVAFRRVIHAQLLTYDHDCSQFHPSCLRNDCSSKAASGLWASRVVSGTARSSRCPDGGRVSEHPLSLEFKNTNSHNEVSRQRSLFTLCSAMVAMGLLGCSQWLL